MPTFKLKVRGYAKADISANWEIHPVDSTLSNVFSGVIDGFDINQWNIESITPSTALVFRKNGIDMNVTESFLLSDITNGDVEIEYFHTEPSAVVMLSARGSIANYNIRLNITSIV